MISNPTAAQIDELAAEYKELQNDAAKAKSTADAFRDDELMPLVRKFGHVPERAKKSRRLEGVEYALTLSTPRTISVSATGVLKLRAALVKNKCAFLFRKLFTREEQFSVADGASELVKEGGWPPSTPSNIKSLFYGCLDIKNGNPSLKVEKKKERK
jgi:hypothetical protein